MSEAHPNLTLSFRADEEGGYFIGAWVYQLAANVPVNPVLGTVANIVIGGLLKMAGDMGVAWFGGKPAGSKP